MTHDDSDRAMAGGRAGYIAGLRRLADLLEQNQAMPLPYYGQSHTAVSVYVHDGDRAGVAAYAAVLEEASEQIVLSDPNDFGYRLDGRLAGLRLHVRAPLDVACQATVTGAETVQTVDWRTPLGVVRAGHRRPNPPESEEPSTDPADLQRLPETDPAPASPGHQHSPAGSPESEGADR